jgi:hypothetical protein
MDAEANELLASSEAFDQRVLPARHQKPWRLDLRERNLGAICEQGLRSLANSHEWCRADRVTGQIQQSVHEPTVPDVDVDPE